MSRDEDVEDNVGATGVNEALEKDEAEKKLEKLLFGDDAGFLEGLNSHLGDQRVTARTVPGRADAEDAEDAEDAGEEDLGIIADEDVPTS